MDTHTHARTGSSIRSETWSVYANHMEMIFTFIPFFLSPALFSWTHSLTPTDATTLVSKYFKFNQLTKPKR